jgi:hypothetical protein
MVASFLLISLARTPQAERVWVVSQGETPPAAIAFAGRASADLGKRVAERLPNWVLETMDVKTLILRPKTLPLLDYVSREIELLEFMRETKGGTIQMGRLKPELREYIQQKLSILGYGELGLEATVHLDARRTYIVEHEKGTFWSLGSQGPDMSQVVRSLDPLAPNQRDQMPDWPISNPVAGLSFHFGSTSKSPSETLDFALSVSKWLRQRVEESERKKAQLAQGLFPDGLPRAFEELPENVRNAMYRDFLASFRALGYESRDEADRAWARRKGFRADTMWFATVAERRRDGTVMLRAVGLFKVGE